MAGAMTAFEVFRQTSIGDVLSIQALRYKSRPFIRLGSEQWTYAEVERQANALATGLRELGLSPGDRLGLILPNIPEFLVTLFAAARAGLILVPVNIRRHPSGIFARFEKTRPRAVVTYADPANNGGFDHLQTLRDLRPDLPGLDFLISLNIPGEDTVSWESLATASASLPPRFSRPGEPAAIVHTLGSSGESRGAVLTHAGLVRNAAAIAANLACTPEDVFLGAVPFSNTFGLTATILACAVSGAQLVCLPHYHPAEALRLVAKAGITVHHGVPTMFALELNHPSFEPQDCATLRTGIISGAPCPPELVHRVHQEIGMDLIIAYGLTEASPAVTMTRFSDGPVTATETVGRPIEGVETKVIGPQGETLPPGEVGELCVRGYNVMLRYWEDPLTTAQVLDEHGWLHTGDLAIIDRDGPMRIVGRKDEVINRGGFKIYPSSVEMVLRAFPGVKEAAVVGVPDMIYGELTCACLVRQPGAGFTSEDILSYAAERLPDYSIPDRVLFFDALPRRMLGPIKRDYLRERARIRGRAWKFGKNIDTDAVIPARHCNTADPRELALHCMEDADPTFVQKMRRGDLIVADTNFGCGSSREVAPLTIKAAGVSAVIAKSFARIFFRNAINIGLPILECPDAVDGIQAGAEVEVEPATGVIRNLSTGKSYQAVPFPDFLQRIIDRGGLLAYVEERLAKENIGGENS